jgi:hypothetical protein
MRYQETGRKMERDTNMPACREIEKDTKKLRGRLRGILRNKEEDGERYQETRKKMERDYTKKLGGR